MIRLFALLLVALVSGSAALAELRIGTLNCFFLVDPARKAEGQLSSKTPPPEVYATKLENLGGFIRGLDVVAVQEIGSELEAKALAKAAGYEARFVQGRDTFTGQDVATLVTPNPRVKVVSASRVQALENLSKHLLVILDKEGTRYKVLNVHLLRPIGRNAEKHAAQIQSIQAWVDSVRNVTPDAVVVVLGDFNNHEPAILTLTDSAEVTNYARTILGGKSIDRIFTSGRLSGVEIIAPPLPKRPNDLLKASWTDHFLVRANVAAKRD